MSASRLSSLLVRDGVLTVKRMEQAFQRQVIYGGTLDTTLLEMNAVPEERLWHYLSLATGLPSADRDLLEYFDPRAVQVCPREVADRYHVAPCALDGPALRCVVVDPVDLGELEGLATELGLPVQPFVVPEFRFHSHLERLYGMPTPARFAALARKHTYVPSALAAAEPSVLVSDEPAPRPAPAAPQAPAPQRTQELGSGQLAHGGDAGRVAARAPEAPAPQTTMPGALAANQARARDLTQDDRPTPPETPAILGKPPVAPPPAAPQPAIRVPESPPDPRARAAARGTIEPPLGPAREHAHPAQSVIADAAALRVDPTPLGAAEAHAALAVAETRDEVFAILARAVRARARYTALLSVQNGVATGRLGIDGDRVDDTIAQVSIPLTEHAALRGAVATRSPFFGPLGTGRADVDVTLERLGGVVPGAGLLLPVAVKDRAVAVVYAHRGADAFVIADVADVLPLATEAGAALLRILAAAKALRAPPVPTAAAQSTIGSYGQPRSMPQLLDAIEADDDALSARAADEALTRPDELVQGIAARFPGRLRIDRYATGGRVLRPAQHGALLALCLRAGARIVPLLVDKLADADREVRYYATLALAELRAPMAVPGLVGRIFDLDFGVRGAALEALAAYPMRDVDDALEPLRRAVRQGGDPHRTRAAAHALGQLRDVRSILDFIDLIDRGDPAAAEALHGLVAITKQDFGLKPKKWRTWFTAERGRHRIEWMIEGLGHGDEHVRRSAIDELGRVTGEYFGFVPDGAKREREDARARWQEWWQRTGRSRFA